MIKRSLKKGKTGCPRVAAERTTNESVRSVQGVVRGPIEGSTIVRNPLRAKGGGGDGRKVQGTRYVPETGENCC